MPNIYESEAFARLPDGSMHPGGLRLTDRAVRLAALREGARVADIGCASGVTTAFLADKHHFNAVGLDISGALIDAGLKNNPGLNLIRWNCETLPFEDGSLDAVFFECTLSVISKSNALTTQNVLMQCASSLKSAGMLIISDIYMTPGAITENALPLTSDFLIEMLLKLGFSVIVQEDHTPALRTYIAELKQQGGDAFDACSFLGTAGETGVRLTDFKYMLIIARKI